MIFTPEKAAFAAADAGYAVLAPEAVWTDAWPRHADEHSDSYNGFRMAFEHAPIGMALIGVDGRYEQVNPAMCQLTGHTAEQLRARAVSDLTHPDDLAADLAAMGELLSGGQLTYSMEKRYLTYTGKIVWGLKSASLVRRDDGTPLYFIAQVQDISERKDYEFALAEERARLHDAEVIGRMGSWDLDVDTGRVHWSDGLFELRGLDRESFAGDWAQASSLVHDDDRDTIAAAIAECGSTGEPMLVRYRVTRVSDGDLRWCDARAKAVYEGDRITRVAGTVIDVTDDVRAAEKAAVDNAFQQAVISASPDIIFVYDLTLGATIWTNRSISEVLGYPTDFDPGNHGVGDVFTHLVPTEDKVEFDAMLDAAGSADGDDATVFKHRLTHADGSMRWFSQRMAALRRDEGGEVDQIVGVLRDITDAIVIEQRLQHSALHDDLTGLPNRVLLLDRLELALARSKRDGREIAILFCDLDGFKRVNDTAGHSAGDAVLVETARRLQHTLRDGDTAARLGGDEFAIIIEPWNRTGSPDAEGSELDRDRALRVAERVIAALREPISVDGIEHAVSASIGISFNSSLPGVEGDGPTPDRVLRSADAAMYLAKSRGKNRIEVYEYAAQPRIGNASGPRPCDGPS